MRLALFQPDIAQNTGTILRLAACLGVAVDVIGPTGFDMTDRALRRAGLDYLDHVAIERHISFAAFQAVRQAQAPSEQRGRLILLSSHADTGLYDHRFAATDTLMLGRESAGVPDSVAAACDARLRIPMRDDLRSLNVAVAAGIALGEAIRQTRHAPPVTLSES